MFTQVEKCSCGRNFMSDDERAHYAVDKIFGNTKFTQISQEHQPAKKQLNNEIHDYKKKYLVENNIDVPKTEIVINSSYYECLNKTTSNERNQHAKEYAKNYNVLCIIFGKSRVMNSTINNSVNW